MNPPRALQAQALWLSAMRRYFACIAIGNLLWEIAHFPLYALWSTGTLAEQVFAIVHCTAGDLVIALCALALGLLAAGDTRWPVAGFARVAFQASQGNGTGIASHTCPRYIRPFAFLERLMPSTPHAPHCLKKNATLA